jgi:hypothetical protein
MLSEERRAFWESFSSLEFVQEDACWSTCSGGFCCDWRIPDFAFRLIPWGGTVFYLEEEFHYYKQNKKIFADEYIKKTSFQFDSEKILNIYYASCQAKDKCKIIVDRSFYCKIYPFLPVFDDNDTVCDLKYISVYDITLDILGIETPCYVKKLRDKYIDVFNAKEIISFIRDPYIMFHLKSACACVENYIENITKSKNFSQNRGEKFWKKWEFEYLTGKYINKHVLSSDISRYFFQMSNCSTL